MRFKPDPSKQVQGVIFSRQIKKPSHPDLKFNNNQVIETPYQKQIGMFFDDRLNFDEHLTMRKKCPYSGYSGLHFPAFGLIPER